MREKVCRLIIVLSRGMRMFVAPEPGYKKVTRTVVSFSFKGKFSTMRTTGQ